MYIYLVANGMEFWFLEDLSKLIQLLSWHPNIEVETLIKSNICM